MGIQFLTTKGGTNHTNPILLGVWEEAVGVHHRRAPDGGGVVAGIGPVSVLLPPEMEEELRPYLGEKIGILRTDSLTKPYRIRLIRK